MYSNTIELLDWLSSWVGKLHSWQSSRESAHCHVNEWKKTERYACMLQVITIEMITMSFKSDFSPTIYIYCFNFTHPKTQVEFYLLKQLCCGWPTIQDQEASSLLGAYVKIPRFTDLLQSFFPQMYVDPHGMQKAMQQLHCREEGVGGLDTCRVRL